MGLTLTVKNAVLTIGARHKAYFKNLKLPVELTSGGGTIDEVSEWDMAFAGPSLSLLVCF